MNPIYIEYYSHEKCQCYKIDLPWDQINMQLPNALLDKIWNLKFNTSANHRSNHVIKKPLFHSVNGSVPDEFKDLVAQEQAKADAYYIQHINELEINERTA